MKVPLGERESQRLEFKAKDILNEPAQVAREAAAMLNAKGGEIWIGVGETAGVASTAQPITEVESARRNLHDSLVARLEPSPLEDELRVEVHSELLVVRTRPSRRGPWAFLERSLRGFVVRVDARTRFLTRDELETRFRASHAEPDALAALATSKAGEGLEIWIEARLTERANLHDPALHALLLDPSAAGNRHLGWHYGGLGRHPRVKQGALTVANEPEGPFLRLTQDGVLQFFQPLVRLHWQGAPREIEPLALIEPVVATFRLARTLFPKAGSFSAALALRGIETWTLRPGSSRSVFFGLAQPHAGDSDFSSGTHHFDGADMKQADRCAFRLLEKVYDHFGYGPGEMPSELDRTRGEFRLTD